MCRTTVPLGAHVSSQGPSSKVQGPAMVLPAVAQRLLRTTELFGTTVEHVLQSDEWARCPRLVECVELFVGVGAVATVAAELGLRSMTYDIKRTPGIADTSEATTTPEVIRTATTLVTRLTTGALLWLALVCASWVFVSSVKCKRSSSNSYEGDCSYPPPPP